MKTIAFLCFFKVISTGPCFAAEVDNFSTVKSKVPDATQVTNTIVNGYLQTLTKKLKTCEVMDLLKATQTVMDENFPEIIDDLERAGFVAEIEKVPLYVGFNAPKFAGCCASVLQFGNTKAGTDKIDHFLSGGYELYMEFRKNVNRGTAQAEKAAIELSFALEDSVWGLSHSGRKSYGDLAANYHGFQFFKQLFEGDTPYLVCEKNRWIQKRKFDVVDYVDDSWDESINCTSYNTQSNRDIVYKNMKRIGFDTCPVDPKKCLQLATKYGRLGPNLLHPRCLFPKSEHNQVELPGATKINVMDFLSPRDYWKLIKGAK